jgi:hypothetical protein
MKVADEYLHFSAYQRSGLADTMRRIKRVRLTEGGNPVLLLGSSTLKNPLSLVSLGKITDGAVVRTSLIKRSGHEEPVYIMASEGAGPSDFYCEIRWFKREIATPRLIVLFVWLGSFIEKPAEFSTTPARMCLSPTDYFNLSLDWDWQIRFSSIAEHVLPLYGMRRHIQDSIVQAITRKHIIPVVSDAERVSKYHQSRKNLTFAKLTHQLEALQEALTENTSASTHCVVVNMPVRSDSVDLSPAYYPEYVSQVMAICKAAGASFVDLQASGSFKDRDFEDFHHLATKSAGEKLVEHIVDIVLSKSSERTQKVEQRK